MNKVQPLLIAVSLLFLLSCKKESTQPAAPVAPTLSLTYTTSPVDLMGVNAKFSGNISYNTHPRSKFDIFLPASNTPTALVIYIHGGGFTGGNKEEIYTSQPADIRYYLTNNMAFASLNYQYATDDTAKGIYASLDDVRLCLQFIRYYAASFNINKIKIGSYGGSAGGGSSIWLAFHPDMADASNSNPIKQQSTRLAAVGHLNSQCSYDPVQMGAIFPGVNYFSIPGVTEQLFDQFNLVSINQLYTDPAVIAIRKDLDMLGWMSTDDPEIFINNNNANVTPTDRGDANHHPFHAKALIDKAAQIGLPYVGYIPSLGISYSSGETIAQFMKRKLQ